MAKIQHLHPRRLATGMVAWHWKPSARLRAKGWLNEKLGEGPPARSRRAEPVPPDAVVALANDRNRRLEEWEAGGAAAAAANKPAPRKWLFQDLVDAYRASPDFALASKDHPDGLSQASRDEYNVRIRQLVFWAQDGQLPIASIDADMVKDLNTALRAGSVWKRAAMLRVLRLLMRWAVREHLIAADPTAAVPIPTPPSRTQRLSWRDTAAAAETVGIDPVARRYLLLAFWMMQRREDMVALGRFAWRQLHGADPRDLPVLVNAKGEVWGFQLQQQKTGTWVICPLPPFLHPLVEEAFAASDWLFAHSLDASLPMSGSALRNRVKPALVAAGFPDAQLRDSRRSGMSGIADMGAERSDVFTISGHPLLGNRRTMADTYMPPDTRAACRAIAAAERTRRKTEAAEKEEQR